LNLRVYLYSLGAIFFFHFSAVAVAAEIPQHASAATPIPLTVPLRIAAVEAPARSASAAKAMKERGKKASGARPLPLGTPEVSDAFKALDSDSETVLKQVLDLGSDLAIVDERENHPAKTQLLVLVSMQPTDLLELDFIELRIDKQVVAAYHYKNEDVSALKKGGAQRLYMANLPTGMHVLKATMLGKIPRDPDYRQEASLKFISGVAREVIELNITSGSNKGFPKLVPRERK